MDNETKRHCSSYEEVNMENHINNLLNDDCLMTILKYLPIVDRLSAEQVCQRWQLICGNMWKNYKKFDITEDSFVRHRSNSYGHAWSDCDFDLAKRVLRKCAPYVVDVNISTIPRPFSIIFTDGLESADGLQFHPSEQDMNDVAEVLAHCESMEKLALELHYMSNDNLSNFLSKSKKLRFLYLKEKRWAKDAMIFTIPYENLETLILSNGAGSGQFLDLQSLRDSTKLKSVSLYGGWRIKEDLIEDFLPKNLVELNIGFQLYVHQQQDRLLDKVRKALSQSQASLKILSLLWEGILFRGLIPAITRNFHNLQALRLCECFTDQLCQINEALPQLVCLYIGYGCTDEGISNINENLKVLVARHSYIQNSGVAFLLQRAKYLEKLDLTSHENDDDITKDIFDIAMETMKLRLKEKNLTPLDIRVDPYRWIKNREYPDFRLKITTLSINIDYRNYIHL